MRLRVASYESCRASRCTQATHESTLSPTHLMQQLLAFVHPLLKYHRSGHLQPCQPAESYRGVVLFFRVSSFKHPLFWCSKLVVGTFFFLVVEETNSSTTFRGGGGVWASGLWQIGSGVLRNGQLSGRLQHEIRFQGVSGAGDATWASFFTGTAGRSVSACKLPRHQGSTRAQLELRDVQVVDPGNSHGATERRCSKSGKACEDSSFGPLVHISILVAKRGRSICGFGFRATRDTLIEMGMGENKTTRGPQVLVFGSIYQGSIFGAHF